MILVIARRAQRDLDEIYDFIADGSPEAAERVVARLEAHCRLLASGLIAGRQMRLRRGPLVRRSVSAPYLIYYHIVGENLEIVRVHHGARRSIEERTGGDR